MAPVMHINCNCTHTCEADGPQIDKYGPHLDTLRALFVSSLENRIYQALETFVYNDTELLSKFPNLKRCLNMFKLFRTIYQSARDPDNGLLEQLLSYTFKHLIKDGLITGFFNAILLNNRLNKVCRDLDSMNVDKHFLKCLKLPRIISKTDESLIIETCESTDNKKAIKRKASNSPDDGKIIKEKLFVTLSLAKVENSYHKRIIKKVSSCGPSSCSFYRSKAINLSTNFYEKKNLKLMIDKNNTTADGIDEKKLQLPCQSEKIIEDLISSDPSVMISCFGNVKRKFKAQIRKICAVVNRIVGRIDKKRVKKCVLYCKIFGNSILFRLKQRGRDGSMSCLFSDRVITRQTSKLSARRGAEKNGENAEILVKNQSLILDLENFDKKFYSDQDFMDSQVIKGRAVSMHHDEENRDGDFSGSDDKVGENIARCSSFYSCATFDISEESKTDACEWCSACAYTEGNSHDFIGQSEDKEQMLKEELMDILKSQSLIEENQLNKMSYDFAVDESNSELEGKIFEILKSIFRDKNLQAIYNNSVSTEENKTWSGDLKKLLKIDQLNSDFYGNEKKSPSMQTITETYQNNSELQSTILKMLESIFREAEAKVAVEKKRQNSSEKIENSSSLNLTNSELEKLITKKLLKILKLLLDISNHFSSPKPPENSYFTRKACHQTCQNNSIKNCQCIDMKTRSISTQTLPENAQNFMPKIIQTQKCDLKNLENEFLTRKKFMSPHYRQANPHEPKINQPKISEPIINSEKLKNSNQNSLICILEETEERTLKCLTSASEISPILGPLLSPDSRSGTFLISRSSLSDNEKLSKVEDLLNNLWSSPLNSSPFRCCMCPTPPPPKDPPKPHFSQDKLHFFLPEINKTLKIILSTMYRRFKIIFSYRAFEKLRYLIKKKLHKLILEREKSTNTSHVCFTKIPNERKKNEKNYLKNQNQNQNREDNFRLKKTTQANKNFGEHHFFYEKKSKEKYNNEEIGNIGDENFDNNFFKRFERTASEGRRCTCCSGGINTREHFGNSGAINSRPSGGVTTGERHLHGSRRRCRSKDPLIYQYPRGSCCNERTGGRIGGGGGCQCQIFSYFNSSGRINNEFREMLVKHVNLCRNVRNSLIRRI